jgi:uncharacterized surface protein with fasciclin (FAS1) repeats
MRFEHKINKIRTIAQTRQDITQQTITNQPFSCLHQTNKKTKKTMPNCYQFKSSILSSLLCIIAASTFTTNTFIVVNGQATCEPDDPDNTILREICSDPDLTTLCGALRETDLDSDLSNNQLNTIFAPINSAFTSAPNRLIGFTSKQLRVTLKYHIISGDIATNSLSCTEPTSTVLRSDFTSQTICNADDTVREGQMGNALVNGTPLFVTDGDSDAPCNGRIIKVTNILGTGITFFPQHKKIGKGSKGSKGSGSGGGKLRGKSNKGDSGGAWRYNNNANNAAQQEDLLYTYFGIRSSSAYNKKGPKSFKAGGGGFIDYKSSKSKKGDYYNGGFGFGGGGGGDRYGKSDKKRKRE